MLSLPHFEICVGWRSIIIIASHCNLTQEKRGGSVRDKVAPSEPQAGISFLLSRSCVGMPHGEVVQPTSSHSIYSNSGSLL